ncbi:nucleoside-diphosphate-sugar epimerase [Nocardia kruczakiae]|uniref:Nucleoside-diphosphate-sugar epimerase n=1 Tax=Nocardia kruczakiae TaxID=261477 RepID=A0ABU1XC21_9NOCA|nr:SDR family oxidoreductase [Nocardia kruczakiae]MDR7168009.1 nucleoside-diphosphate-sugar epimerase [Nocardia kruczakiae]
MTGYLVDGATELLGAALILELLDRTDRPVHATAAPHTGDVATVLRAAASAYGYDGEDGDGFLDRHAERLHIAESAQAAVATGTIGDVWHCPQRVVVEDELPGGDVAVDVEAARALLAAAEAAGVTRFELLGTAYVSGSATGRIEESDPVDGAGAGNEFERSHLAIEQLAGASALTTRIWRTGIVTGHSRTFEVVGTSPFYGLFDAIARTKHGVEALVGSLMSMRAMAIALDPALELNLVPVDAAVASIVTASLDSEVGAPIVHVTNARTATLGGVLAAAFDALRMAAPDYVESTASCLGLEEQCDAEIRSYGSCFTVPKEFAGGAAHTGGALDIEISPEVLAGLFRARAGLVEAGR